ncbi:unnamed protein product [Urochloa humidicola]
MTAEAVFELGPYEPVVRHARRCQVKDLPKPLVVAAPKEAGSYPVLVFLHGWNLCSWWYRCLLSHVASHGFIVVAPQLHEFFNFSISDADDIETTKKVTNWLANNKQEHEAGLLYVLTRILKLEGVTPDLTRLALAGHSRGGDTAFAVALGRKGDDDHTLLDLKFKALIGIDPAAGVSIFGFEAKVQPPVLDGSFDPRMPTLVVGTGKGSEGLVPCAPDGMNHVQFYNLCVSQSPSYHFRAKDYGHLDMLDDEEPPPPLGMCPSGCDDDKEHTCRKLCRITMGGLVVAFLKDTLESQPQYLKAVIYSPCIAPATLDQVEPAKN